MKRIPLALAMVVAMALSGGGSVTAGGSAHYWFRSGIVTVAKANEQVRLHFVNASTENIGLSMWVKTASGNTKTSVSISSFHAGFDQTIGFDPGAATGMRGEIMVSADPSTPVGSFLASLELMRKDSHGVWRTVTVLDSFYVVAE